MNELTYELMCIAMRNGVEVWIEKSKMVNLETVLSGIKQSTFIGIEGRTINTADIVGIFTPEDMSDNTRRKKGEWQCSYGAWHGKNEKCECKMGMSSVDKIRYMYGN
jgi:isopropylmalate/homocitrate/citramalate synthase